MSILLSAGIILVFLVLIVVVALSVPMPAKDTNEVSPIVSSLVFPEQSHQNYVDRMTTAQPVFNDRLLEGEGKNHMLDAIAKVASNKDASVQSVLNQVGDTFS